MLFLGVRSSVEAMSNTIRDRGSPNRKALVEALKADAVRALRRLPDAAETEHPLLYREAAEAMVKLRGLFTTGDGRPDWRGQSWEYRQAVSDIYNSAHLPPEPNAPAKSALRYHLGNLLRERLSASELEEAGLNTMTPKDRAYQRFLAKTNLAEFARSLIYHIEVRPNEPAPAEVVDRAEEVRGALDRWITRQRRMSSK